MVIVRTLKIALMRCERSSCPNRIVKENEIEEEEESKDEEGSETPCRWCQRWKTTRMVVFEEPNHHGIGVLDAAWDMRWMPSQCDDNHPMLPLQNKRLMDAIKRRRYIFKHACEENGIPLQMNFQCRKCPHKNCSECFTTLQTKDKTT